MQGLDEGNEVKGPGEGKGGNGNFGLLSPSLLGGDIEGIQLAVTHRVHDTWLLKRVMRVNAAGAFRNIVDATLGAKVPYVDGEDTVQILPEGQREFTATAATDLINITAHGIPAGTTVQVSSSGTLPAGLTAGTTYYVRDVVANGFKLYTVATGGTAVDITSTGTGTHTLVFVSVEEAFVIGQYAPSFETFRAVQIVSNELLADSTVMETVSTVMAKAIAERVQGYLLGRIGAAIAVARHNVNATTDGHATFTNLLRLVSNIGPAAVGGVAASTTLFNCTQRSRLLLASHSVHQSHHLATDAVFGTANQILGRVMATDSERTEDGVYRPVYSVPWYTDDSLPSATSGLAIASTPDIMAFDPMQVMLAEKPLVIALDTESRMASNQTVIHATYRAAGALMHPKAAAGYSLYTRS